VILVLNAAISFDHAWKKVTHGQFNPRKEDSAKTLINWFTSMSKRQKVNGNIGFEMIYLDWT
jgi:hypothetical protein